MDTKKTNKKKNKINKMNKMNKMNKKNKRTKWTEQNDLLKELCKGMSKVFVFVFMLHVPMGSY